MNRIYDQLLNEMEILVDLLAKRVPKPKFVAIARLRAYRHVEKTIHQAIVQKLARMVSTLSASRLLLNNGFVQEQASLQRILDEIQEDISFLVFGVLSGEQNTHLHKEYLSIFFQEEFDADSAIESTQKRPMIRRQKIRAYLARSKFYPGDPSTRVEVSRTINKAYSGFVHAASPHIMDMYWGSPGRFHMRGLKDSPIYGAHQEDLWNYYYRGIATCALAAKSFGDELLFEKYHSLLREFERLSGRSYAEK